jgi:hypothetical protein
MKLNIRLSVTLSCLEITEEKVFFFALPEKGPWTLQRMIRLYSNFTILNLCVYVCMYVLFFIMYGLLLTPLLHYSSNTTSILLDYHSCYS